MILQKKSFLVLGLLISNLTFAESFSDMNANGHMLSQKYDKSIKSPTIENFKSCASISTGIIGYTNDDRMMFRSKFENKEGVIIDKTFIADSKIDELERKYNKNCTFKTVTNGKELYFTLIGTGDERKISFSPIKPATICSDVTTLSLTDKQFQKQLVDLKTDIKNATKVIIDNFKSEDKDRKLNMVNKSVATKDKDRFKVTWNGCVSALKEMSHESTEPIEKLITDATKQYEFNNSSTTFADTNGAVGGKDVQNLILDWSYSKELNACVDNLPLNKNINTIGDNIVFTGVDKSGIQNFYYKSKDGNYYSISKNNLTNTGACQELQGSGIRSCEYHNEFTLPTGEKVGVSLFTSNVKQADGSYKQIEQVDFTNYLASNLSYTKVPFEIADPKTAASAMVGSIQQALTNYPNDFSYHGANKISDETKEMFKKTFSDCKDFLNKIAPSEKKWNEFAYNFSIGNDQSRGIASEDIGPSSSISK